MTTPTPLDWRLLTREALELLDRDPVDWRRIRDILTAASALDHDGDAPEDRAEAWADELLEQIRGAGRPADLDRLAEIAAELRRQVEGYIRTAAAPPMPFAVCGCSAADVAACDGAEVTP